MQFDDSLARLPQTSASEARGRCAQLTHSIRPCDLGSFAHLVYCGKCSLAQSEKVRQQRALPHVASVLLFFLLSSCVHIQARYESPLFSAAFSAANVSSFVILIVSEVQTVKKRLLSSALLYGSLYFLSCRDEHKNCRHSVSGPHVAA